MKNEQLLCAMGQIEDTYIAAAAPCSTTPRSRKRFLLATAACLVLVCITCGSVFAATDQGTKLLRWFIGWGESGYDLSVEVERIPISELKGPVRTAEAAIRQQYADYQPYSSWWPGHWLQRFDTAQEAVDYIGFDALRLSTWPQEETAVTLNVIGDETGKLLQIMLETDYQAGEVRMQAFAELYTEHCTEEIVFISRTTEHETYTETFYTTAGGLRCQVLTSSANQNGWKTTDGFLIKEGILYHLHLAYRPLDSEQAAELLHQWADGF